MMNFRRNHVLPEKAARNNENHTQKICFVNRKIILMSFHGKTNLKVI